MKGIMRWLMRNVPRPWLIRFSLLFGWMLRPFYAGNKVQCPVCGHRFRKFMPYGIARRENVLCPSCFSLERHRLLYLWWKNRTDFFEKPSRVLHVAPEQCFHKGFKSRTDWDYTTADLESPMADLHFDLHRIPLDNDTFDWVICNHVLEHVEDDRLVLSEILRILKPGGRAIMQVPLDYNLESTFEEASITEPSDREKHYGQRDHVRLYGRDYSDRLRMAGFIVENIDYLAEIPAELRQRYRLPGYELIHLAIKA